MSFFANPGNVYRAEAQQVRPGDFMVVPLQHKETKIVGVEPAGGHVVLRMEDGTSSSLLPRNILLVKRGPATR